MSYPFVGKRMVSSHLTLSYSHRKEKKAGRTPKRPASENMRTESSVPHITKQVTHVRYINNINREKINNGLI